MRAWLSASLVHRLVALCALAALLAPLAMLLARRMARIVDDAADRARIRMLVALLAASLFLILAGVVFGMSLGSLSVAAGVLGAGLAFAAQEVIASFAGWLAILFARFYRVGDRVELGGIRGDVIDIGILRTRVMEIGQWVHSDMYNGRIVLIANSFIFKEPVFNYTGNFPFLWDEIRIPIRSDGDIETARGILLRVAKEVTDEFSALAEKSWEKITGTYLTQPTSVEPLVTLVVTDNWMEFTIRYVVQYNRRRTTQDRIFTRIAEELAATNGRINFGSATTQIIPPSTLDINIGRKKEPADG